MEFNAKTIRNIAVIGHGGEGKTSLCETILFNSGMTDRIGKVIDGTTVMDQDEQEIARKISISLSMSIAIWGDVKINLIDVPGFYDFEAEVAEAMRAIDCALVVTNANGIVTVGAEKSIDYCLKRNIPMIIFINGMDKENADYLGTLKAFKEKYPGKIAPIQIPIMEGNKMRGYTNVLKEKSYMFSDKGPIECEMPQSVKEEFNAIKNQLIETSAENEDILLEKFFNGETLTKEEIILGIRKGISCGNTIPIMAGSAINNKGVFNLMDEIVKYSPSPDENDRITAFDFQKDKKVSIVCSEKEPLCAQVFKTICDPFVGKMNYVRVFSGVIKQGSSYYNSKTGEEERINQILNIKGKKQEQVSEIKAGDIGIVTKLINTNTSDTLCSENYKYKMKEIVFMPPCLSMAVYAKKQGDEEKIFQGLRKIAEEDLSFTVTKNIETGEMLINGQGETHLDVIAKKLKSKFNVEADLKVQKIPYRETIKSISDAEGKHKKQSGGHGQYGHCKMRFEPYKDGDFIFEEEVVGGTVPKQYIPAVEKGIRECLPHGVLAGFPVVNLKAVLYDGSYHDVDSSEMAFKIAASIAYKDGLKKASPVILEPIMSLKIKVPEVFLGDIMGDINKRRGKILGIDLVEEFQEIKAEAPLQELLKYATELRSMTQGRGRFSMEFIRYEELPPLFAEKIIKEHKEE